MCGDKWLAVVEAAICPPKLNKPPTTASPFQGSKLSLLPFLNAAINLPKLGRALVVIWLMFCSPVLHVATWPGTGSLAKRAVTLVEKSPLLPPLCIWG